MCEGGTVSAGKSNVPSNLTSLTSFCSTGPSAYLAPTTACTFRLLPGQAPVWGPCLATRDKLRLAQNWAACQVPVAARSQNRLLPTCCISDRAGSLPRLTAGKDSTTIIYGHIRLARIFSFRESSWEGWKIHAPVCLSLVYRSGLFPSSPANSDSLPCNI
jgi:hypothetical protein